MKIKKNITLISLMLGVMMLVSLTGMISATTCLGGCNDCGIRERVDTYQSDYSTLKGTFNQGETVYAKGWDGTWNLRILFLFPNGTIAKTCDGNPGTETTCNFALPSNAPTGTWKVELQYYDRMWIFWDCETFTVNELVCELTVDEPVQGTWFDSEAVPVEWHVSQGCTPIDHFWLYYKQNGDCNDLDHGWYSIIDGSNAAFGSNPYNYLWDRPLESGQYCVKVKVTSNGARDASGVFNVDLAPPEVTLSVGNPKFGDCNEGTGTCYVNKNTDISLSCLDENPDEPWQSGVDYIEYRYSVDGGEFTGWEEYNGAFNFPEDTNHLLEYRCFDNVGKFDSESKNFVVESVAPILTKEVKTPKVEGCDDKWECDWYVTQDTEICLSAYDPEPHPVGEVVIDCEYSYWTSDPQTEPTGKVDVTLDENGCFTYDEDSWHELHCWAEDALENTFDLYEADIVDTLAPITDLNFKGPYYANGNSQWIDGVSTVELLAKDQEPHPVGVDKTYYRYGVVDDKFCYGTDEKTSLGEAQWTEYEGEFGIPEESCHLIEYYSVDELGNTEVVQQEFVFVDKTAPNTVKEVGKPSHDCNGLWEDVSGQCEEGWDWIVTMDTEITLSCSEEGENHPSGVKELCYRIFWDGKVVESWTCVPESQMTEGKVLVKFKEECEHTLEFYCVDNVGKKTLEPDSELFKVEGKKFEIPLNKKWNLISVPVNLISNDVEEVFSDISDKVEGVWGYDSETGWHLYAPGVTEDDLTTIEQGYGYWVKTTEDTALLVGGSELNPGPVGPPGVDLEKGWNLIGRYGLSTSENVYCSLFSLVDTAIGHPRWSALWGYDSSLQKFMALDLGDSTHPGEGYWIEMDVEDSYSPSTMCWGWPIHIVA